MPASSHGFQFDDSLMRALPQLAVPALPAPAPSPQMVMFNHALAAHLGLSDALSTNAALLSGTQLPAGASPVALAYAGHQFGHFTFLGDGRAHLLGEHLTPEGARVDVQFKGSGHTPFSRRGDGRAALGPMLREYVVSEAMHALGIPTTRSLAVVATGEPVLRETLLHGAVLTRVAASHLRVGTFEYLAAKRDVMGLRALVYYALARHFPQLASSSDTTENPARALLRAVAQSQASLVAQWVGTGFIHGVMNTDNMAISGETIDYGPCAFMDAYAPDTVFSSIDRNGRYAFANQPRIAQWNIARLAEALLPLLAAPHAAPHAEAEDEFDESSLQRAADIAEGEIDAFADYYHTAWLALMRRKLGLLREEAEDAALIQDFLSLLHAESADYTNSFRALAHLVDAAAEAADDAQVANPAHRFAASFPRSHAADAWAARFHARHQREAESTQARARLMQSVNAAYIPRNHILEAALKAADGSANSGEHGGENTGAHGRELAPLTRLLSVLAQPYAPQPEHSAHRLPAPPSERVYQTFCGT